ncbi:MAG: hypothetical protein ACJA07_000484 [Rhodococcus sp. (in: high G+C Gram-positive bacteria)]|jgi:hypothetical protein
MRVYISKPKGYATNLPEQLRRVVKLYRKGVIDDNSKVWINTNVVSPIFWVLGDRATCIYWYSAPTSGFVRLTQDRLRWAPTFDETGRSPMLDFSPTSIPVLDSDARLTFVVDHNYVGSGASGVGVVEDSKSQKMVGGYHEGSDIAVIDLANYDRSYLPVRNPSRIEYDDGLAKYSGMRLLAAGMGKQDKADLLDSVEEYGYNFDPDTLDQLVKAIDSFDVAANFAVDAIYGDSAVN